MKTIKPELRPTVKQEAAWDKLLDKTTRFLLFGGGAGGGKTWLYCEWLLTRCYQHPGSRWFIACNELKRLMASIYVTRGKVCAHHRIPKSHWTLDGKYNVIRFKNGSTIDLLDVKYMPTDADYERFGSPEYNGGFGEEIGEWHFKAFDVLKSRIGRHKLFRDGADVTPFPKFGLSCNPTKSWPYRVFFKPWKEGTLPEGYAFIQALYLDKPAMDLEGKQAIAPFQNLKAQCGFKLAELVEMHRIAAKPLGDEDEIAEDLAQIRQKDIEKNGKLKILPKEEVREALGRSPDTGDTFLMRMYFELLRDASGQQNQPSERSLSSMRRGGLTRRRDSRGV